MSNAADALPSSMSLGRILADVAVYNPPKVTVKALGGWLTDTTNGRQSHNRKKWVVGADINHHGGHVFFSKSGKRQNIEEQPQT